MLSNLSYAFRDMRRLGLLVKQHFMDDVEEAGSAITTEAAALVQQGVRVKGCCYYTKTDQGYMKGWDFWLSYGPMTDWQIGRIGISPEGVGRLVVRCLAKYDVDYLWTGEGNTKIMVKTQTIREMVPEEAKACKLPAKIEYRMGRMERPYWMHYSIN